MALRFLHSSDIHLLDLRGVMPWRYLGKRLTGGMNLALSRSRAHDGRLFDEILSSLRSLAVERLVLTGDLTNLSLEPEFELVRRKLDLAGVPVTAIPGNHDAYTRGSHRHRRFERFLDVHMRGHREHGSDYPYMTCVGDVALIGVSSAVATWPFYATGTIGRAQLQRLERMLIRARKRRLQRVVLVHHPVVDGVAKPRHDLLDRADLAGVIARQGAELVLHGHEHRHLEGALPGPDHQVPVHGVGSGTSLSQRPQRQAAFTVYEVSKHGISWDRYLWNGSRFTRQDA